MNYPRIALAAIAGLIVFFAYGFLTEGWLIGKDFALSVALYRDSNSQLKCMPLGMASILIGLIVAAAIHAKLGENDKLGLIQREMCLKVVD